MTKTRKPLSKPKKALFGALFLSFSLVFACLFIEGMSSAILLFVAVEKVQERKHTKYHPELGWANLPNFHDQDLYRPNVGFTTNSQGFRAKHDFTPETPEGKRRVICSGDSYTMGYGVADG